ncbi:hypothetical protein TRAPUB_4703 [Trametes pubescens]|uniref:Uncharacterized protein n=1 Tax=Trametes pubescens TaxID=154538 RepID=A0A1M2VAE4_TRAPU|nr:hypothetical protein TRAPUB_4703 [Trametes pubescens]
MQNLHVANAQSTKEDLPDQQVVYRADGRDVPVVEMPRHGLVEASEVVKDEVGTLGK